MPDRTGGRYDGRTIVLHWVTAVLIAEQWISAHLINDFAGFAKLAMRSTHITLGVVLGLVLIARIAWRNLGGRHLRADDAPLLEAFAKITHWALYALMVLVVALGISMVAQRGANLFGLHLSGLAPQDRALGRQIHSWHVTAANAILVLAGMHAAAALFHHYVWRDGVLRRMLPGWR
jgi:cytochrome b561